MTPVNRFGFSEVRTTSNEFSKLMITNDSEISCNIVMVWMSLSQMTNSNKEVIIVGDLNVNFLKSQDNKEIKDTMKLYGFTQLINKPTRITQETYAH